MFIRKNERKGCFLVMVMDTDNSAIVEGHACFGAY
jgi:hypothetical protein